MPQDAPTENALQEGVQVANAMLENAKANVQRINLAHKTVKIVLIAM